MEGRAKDSRSCVWRDPAWHGRGGWREVVGEHGGSAMPLRGGAGTVALQWARADAHHSLAGRRGPREGGGQWSAGASDDQSCW